MIFIKRSFCMALLSFLVLLPAIVCAQQQLRFGNLTLEQGLSQNSVMTISQDRQQLLWFGTKHGLNRYDGYQFKVYKNNPKDTNSISSDEITATLSDSKGILWVGTVNGLNRYDAKKDNFQRIFYQPKNKKGLSSNSIEHIYEDPKGNIWVGTLRGANLLTNRNKNEFQTFLFKDDQNNRGINNIYSIIRQKDGAVWLATLNGLVRMNLTPGKFSYEAFHYKGGKPGTISSNYITSLQVDKQQNLWVGTDNGLNLFQPDSRSFLTYKHNENSNSIVHNDIREIMLNRDGTLWIGTQEGLSILDPQQKTFSNYLHDPEKKGSLSHNSIHSIYQDRNNSIWIGTFYGGVNIIHPFATQFHASKNSRLRPSISSNIVSSIVEDTQHNLWIGTEGGGLNYFNRSNNTYTAYKINLNDKAGLTSNLIKTICKDKAGNLLIGTHHGGLNFFNTVSKTFQHIVNIKDSSNTASTAEIIAICAASDQNIWVGTYSGLNLLKTVNGHYETQTRKSPVESKLQNKRIQFLYEDRDKNLWIGTQAGLHAYHLSTKKLRSFFKDKGNADQLQSDYINCIVQISNGNLAIGTYFGGLSIYNPKSGKFKTYTEKEGLSNNNVLGIIEDEQRNLWISTDHGLSKFDPKTQTFRIYTKSDGIAGNDFNVRSYFKDSAGELFFGGYNGLTSFFPAEIEINSQTNPIIFTGLKLFNKPVTVDGPDQLLKEDISSSKSITFGHDQNHFTIGFALLNYIKPDKNRYSYKLESYDEEWNEVSNPFATYTNLPSGTYTFLVKGKNNDGTPGGSVASIDIHILPPIWASWWAYCIYALIISIILFLSVRYLIIRALLKRSEDIQQMKLSFFTNISHEIRTPLTLILGPLENLLKSTEGQYDLHKQVLPIKNNADRLMRLITELMDFRKADSGYLKLNISPENIVSFSKEIFYAFQHLAVSRNIRYTFNSTDDPILLYFDKVQMEKVLFNLLSNAFKFTDDEGSISLSIDDQGDAVEIKIRDNGKGIPYESQNKLFSNFFQVDEQGSNHIGSGIGLALSKSVVEAHHGKIGIESNVATAVKAGDTCFTVKLKKGKAHFKADQLQENQVHDYSISSFADAPAASATTAAQTSTIAENNRQMESNELSPSGTEKSTLSAKETVLIVEDNPEIRDLIANLMKPQYQVEESVNGLKGWEAAIELLPDLIICDIMMPVMDGLELCRRLKTDERTSHIPVILLTARSSHIHQVSGLETGADVYVTKPFSTALLELNVRNLLQSRAMMRQKYAQQVILQPQNIVIGATDQAFMEKVMAYIEANLADQEVGVPELAIEVGMSQPILYKKIRAITDLSVNDFIKTIRLKKAAQLLEHKVYTISEISYLVGFNDPKYFSREFKKQYGVTPRVFIQNLHDSP
ncbi:two-component regulator propeller domain-containing protein [Pedobacter gandavensis]|uniref:hybrid sensor histidine kinase/response regulator transcription factor n=1 Tax=Pedobacter gandavensis TaxID=2679963 RepID=UPI00247AFD70|nr:hybrid sensor histidine kinase/response regulator transcription factor [Pedobacter gandavensis]WGQ08780.1 two-component regulator propeller domain-containing protein [Pedobacter gandavensis]